MGRHVASRSGNGHQPKSVKTSHTLSQMKAQVLLLLLLLWNYILEMELIRLSSVDLMQLESEMTLKKIKHKLQNEVSLLAFASAG